MKRPRSRVHMERGVSLLLSGMGIDLKDPNFVDTPKRVARMYIEMLSPKQMNWATFPSSSADLIILRGHHVFAICPHHLLPVELRAYVGYIPNECVLGLSKLGRVVEQQLTKPVLQEDLTQNVAQALHDQLKPKGVGVVLAGTHGCMKYRGIETTGDVITSAMRGVLLLNPSARSEFLQLIGTP
jgi:GTP cyclohydrolase I